MARMGKEAGLANSDWDREDRGRGSESRPDHHPEELGHCKLAPKQTQTLPAALLHLMTLPSL